MPDEPAPPTRDELLRAAATAHGDYCHAETIIQSRLYNYLIAVSVLFLSWAAVFASRVPGRAPILVVLAMLSLLLSVGWTVLGLRARKFLELHRDIMLSLEEKLPTELRVWYRVAEFQKNGNFQLLSQVLREKGPDKVTYAESKVTARWIPVAAPFAFALASLVLIMFVFLSWSSF